MIWLVLAAQGGAIDVAVHGNRVAVAEQGRILVDGHVVETGIEQLSGVAFAPDGTPMAFGGRPGQEGAVAVVGKWRAGDHSDMVNAVAFGTDWIATGSHDRTIIVRDWSGRFLRRLEGHTGPVLALAARPDGRILVSAGADRALRVWDPQTGERKRSMSNHGDRVGAIVYSPDGRYLASGGRDRTVRIWQPEIGRLVKIIRGHEGEVLDLAWGGTLVSAAADGKVRALDWVEACVLEERAVKGGTPMGVAIAGKRVFIAAGDGVDCWDP